MFAAHAVFWTDTVCARVPLFCQELCPLVGRSAMHKFPSTPCSRSLCRSWLSLVCLYYLVTFTASGILLPQVCFMSCVLLQVYKPCLFPQEPCFHDCSPIWNAGVQACKTVQKQK
ncbi:hypothetical protein BsWGS_07006 [Bradybaena similaris]